MSFRLRLTLFFVVIVIVPMIAVALVLFRVVSDSEQGKSDARLGQAQRGASGLFQDYQRRAEDAGREIGSDIRLAGAVESRDERAIRDRLQLLARDAGAVRVTMRVRGVASVDVGVQDAVAPAASRLLDAAGRPVGELTASVVTAPRFAAAARDLTGLEVVVQAGDRTLASTLADTPASLPLRGEIKVGSRDFRVAGYSAPAFGGGDLTVRVLADERDTRSNIGSSTVKVGIALAAFLLLAFTFALTVSRSLQAQIQRLLEAARRLGGGDFRVNVPTEGNDEFAELGTEFNAMARQLESRLEDLHRERARLRDSIRRVGDSFARGLDRDALLELAVQTAIDGTGAACGRATVRTSGDGKLRQAAGEGDLTEFSRVIHAVEAAALEGCEGAEVQVGSASALAEPLIAEDDENKVLGLISVARSDQPFSETERELFHWLAGQAAISIENADLHETVQRQAVTDELTGLFNHRHFQEVLAGEVERARRYEQELGLIMLDIDNFKEVNDTYGHLQGDLVLREVAKVLRESAREIDEPARYGGEEMAVVLPQTDLDGAFRFAERVRKRIEQLDIKRVEGEGTIKITASLGAASVARNGSASKDALVGAADAALYRAKRAGKNRTVRAEAGPAARAG